MDIMELGAIGELVGGVAVIASLLFVGVQVRQSNRQARHDAAREVSNQFDSFFEMIISDPNARKLWMVGTGGATSGPMENPADLDPDDFTVFGLVMARAWHQFEIHYQAWKSGTLGDEHWSKVLPFIRFHLASEPALEIWKWHREGWHEQRFIDFVDGEVEKLHAEKS